MKLKQNLMTSIGVIVASVFVLSLSAQASSEIEPNSSLASSQGFASSGNLNVSGSLTFLGTDPRTRQPIRDVDFYSFFAFAGDKIDVGVSGVNNNVALFGLTPGYALLATGDASSDINGHVIKESGMFTVAVANNKAFFYSGGAVAGGDFEEGAYSLSVTGLSVPLVQIDIDVKPRHKKVARINLRKRRSIKVAILGKPGVLDVVDVDPKSLTFGATGDEKTLRKCKRRFKDVNRDGVPDLVCKFSLRHADFDKDSTEAVLKGETRDGVAFYGTDQVEVKKRRKVAHRSRKK